jgi:hypothetical protein
VKREGHVTRDRFESAVVDTVARDLVIGVRAGTGDHRFTSVWGVTVDLRVFIRSWGLAERSWFHSFRREPVGVAQIGGRQFAVRAVKTRSERTLDAVDEAYRLKYNTPASAEFVRGLVGDASRDTTTELVPLA